MCFFAVIEFGVGPEFLPAYRLISNWAWDYTETIFGRCYCYFQNSWPNYPTREDSLEFVVEDGIKVLTSCGTNHTVAKSDKTNFLPHGDHVIILFDGPNEQITIVNRSTDCCVVTRNIIPCCYRYGFVFVFQELNRTRTKDFLKN